MTDLRIASLLASGTEMVCALGLEDRLVAISHECDHPERVLDRPRISRPRFDPEGMTSGQVDRAVRHAMEEHGSVYEIRRDRLAELAPDVILTQAVCEVCAVPTPGVHDAVEQAGIDARILSLDAHTMEEILESMLQVGRAAGAEEAAEREVASRRERLRAASRAVEGADRPRVLALEWLDPPFAPGHWVPEMVRLAGGQNLLGEEGAPSRQVDWEQVEGMDPDVLVIMPCGYDLPAARRDADAFTDRLEAVAPRAIRDGRAYAVDASAYFNRSGPRVVRGVEILTGLLHPDRMPEPEPPEAGRWEPAPARA